jgi:prepilin-type N-terminal cleavage/methylation domain-containing protein
MLKNRVHSSRVRNRARLTGFTLIEVMLAVVMAAIIFTAVSFGLSTGYNVVQVSREQLRANQVCLSRVEGIRLCRYTDQLFDTNIVPQVFTDYFYPVGMGSSNTTAFITYNGTVTLETNFTLNPQPSYIGSLCRVTVTVTWDDRCFSSTMTRTQSVTTLICKSGVQNYVYWH